PYTEYRQDRFQSDRRVYGSFESDMQTPQMLGLQVEEARTSDLRSSNVGSRYHTGTEVIRVMNNSPADRAGLRSGDIIVEIDGRSNITPDLLHRRLSQRSGQPVELTVIRNDRERNITLRGDSFDNRRFGTDQRFDDSWGTPRDQFRRPSDQEDLFRLP